MALPEHSPTPRMRELEKIAQASSKDGYKGWPSATAHDYLIIGTIVVLFNFIDLSLRRMVEILDLSGMLAPTLLGKSANLTITDVEKALKSMPDWSDKNRLALERILEQRKLRNLVAHFAVRRFPNDDAYLFVTKSARDFKRQFGADPPSGIVMFAIIDAKQCASAVVEIRGLVSWVIKATDELEEQFLSKKRKR